jgi:SAM-dependent methyltransferase
MTLLGGMHTRYVHGRRVERLGEQFAALLPANASVLDVGCGDGRLARLVGERRADLQLRGVDVLVRPDTAIPVEPFDGRVIPFADHSLDALMFADVLHHADDPLALLREAARTARKAVVIKDHLREGVGANVTLRFMDWVGNARYGVALPYRYWNRREWQDAFAAARLVVEHWQERLSLYPLPASWLFDRSLHFVARLRPA